MKPGGRWCDATRAGDDEWHAVTASATATIVAAALGGRTVPTAIPEG
jgi:hypothetical protein